MSVRYIYMLAPFVNCASVAQLAEQLICNQQVAGSNPTAGFNACWITGFLTSLGVNKSPDPLWIHDKHNLVGFPSGQRGQTVNLMAQPSKVRILHPPLLSKTRLQAEGLRYKWNLPVSKKTW